MAETLVWVPVPVSLDYVVEMIIHRETHQKRTKPNEHPLTGEEIIRVIKMLCFSAKSGIPEAVAKALEELKTSGIISELPTDKDGPCYVCKNCDSHRHFTIVFATI